VVTQRAVALAELRSRGEFVQALLAGDGDDAGARRRGRSAGVDVDAVTAVAVLDPGARDVQPAARVAARLAEGSRGWSAEHQGRVAVLLTGPTAEDAQAWLETLGTSLPAAVGWPRVPVAQTRSTTPVRAPSRTSTPTGSTSGWTG
jgi:hypothetical protein